MRLVTVVLLVLLALIQYPLWWGHGGWLHVRELRQQLAQQQRENSWEKLRNERLSGEVQGLDEGTAAVEERARYEMGMLKASEAFVQFVPPASATPTPSPDASTTSTRGVMSAEPVAVVPNPVSNAPRKRGGHEKKKGRAAR